MYMEIKNAEIAYPFTDIRGANKFGNRYISVVISDKATVKSMKEDGFDLYKAKGNGKWIMKIVISLDDRHAPKIRVHDDGDCHYITKENIDAYADLLFSHLIKKVDITSELFRWEFDGHKGIKAFLNSMDVYF